MTAPEPAAPEPAAPEATAPRLIVLVPSRPVLAPGDVPDGIDVVLWDGGPGVPLPERQILDSVVAYVPSYMGSPSSWAPAEDMPALRIVQLLSAGYDSVPQLPQGVALHNAGPLHDDATGELAVALTLSVLRGLDSAARDMVSGTWAPRRHPGLADARVLVLGAGGVGSSAARRFAAFGTEVVRVGRSSRTDELGPIVESAALPELLGQCEVVVLAVPLNSSTRGMVDATFLASMGDGTLLVNVSRGPVVNTDALLAELTCGRLRAALDVTDPEPLPPDHPLWRAPGVLISPHVGGNTGAFERRARSLLRDQLVRLANGETLPYRVR